MATIWVDNVLGNNANNGIAVVDGGTGPKATIGTVTGGLRVMTSVNNVMNVVNTGTTYDISDTQNIAVGSGMPGTSFTNFGAKIQGVEADGSPAINLVKIRYTTVGTSSAIGVRENQHYIIVQGFYVDRPNSTLVSSGTGFTFVNLNDSGAGTAGPILIQACVDESSSNRNGALLRESSGSVAATGSVEIRYCLIKNWGTNGGVTIVGATHKQLLFHHNVAYHNIASTVALVNLGVNDNNAGVDHEITYNTLVATERALWFTSNNTNGTGANAAAKKYINNNVIVQFTAAGGTDQFILGSATWEDIAWTGLRDIGYNVFVDAGGHSWAANHPYMAPWDPDDSDTPEGTSYWPTDTVDENPGADPFEDSGTAFDWEPGGLGYTIPLPGDYRLAEYRTAGFGGSVPGAIPEGAAVPSDPVEWIPGDAGLPVGPNAPAFLFDGPDGINAAVRIRRNTELDVFQLFDGDQETITRVRDGLAVVNTNVAAATVMELLNARLFMLETDAPITIQLNSQQLSLLAGGCVLLAGANITTFKVTNTSALRQVNLKYFGAK